MKKNSSALAKPTAVPPSQLFTALAAPITTLSPVVGVYLGWWFVGGFGSQANPRPRDLIGGAVIVCPGSQRVRPSAQDMRLRWLSRLRVFIMMRFYPAYNGPPDDVLFTGGYSPCVYTGGSSSILLRYARAYYKRVPPVPGRGVYRPAYAYYGAGARGIKSSRGCRCLVDRRKRRWLSY